MAAAWWATWGVCTAVEIEYRPLTGNLCFQRGKKLMPKGIMVHSTATPGVMAERFLQLWNVAEPGGRQVCVHAFLDNTGVYQTLPWEMAGWHAGGSGNETHIGFEICEPADLGDRAYFGEVWQKAVELCALLCRLYDLTEGDILCHSEGYQKGIASNHADVMHWFPLHGKNMDDFRQAVGRQLEEEEKMIYNQIDSNMPAWAREPVQWAVERGILAGDGQGLALDDKDLRVLAWIYRAEQARQQ